MAKIDLLQGTLDMLILRVLARGEMHGWGIVDRLSQLSKNTLKLGEGSVYPSLYRMEDIAWVLRTDTKRNQVGFVRSKDLKINERFVLEED